MADTNKTAEQLASDFVAMGHSEQLITNVIAGNEMADASAEEKKDAVKRNVEHLEQKKLEKTELDNTVSVWTTEDFTAIAVPNPRDIRAFLILFLISGSVSAFLPVVNPESFVTVAPVNGGEANALIAFLVTFQSAPGFEAATGTPVITFSPSKIIAC